MSGKRVPLLLAPALLVTTLLTACDKPSSGEAHHQQMPRKVRVETVAFTDPETTLTYSGTVQARVLAVLSFRVGGKIVAREVNVGDRVASGQVLARLDPVDLGLAVQVDEQAVAAAEADAHSLAADFARFEQLGRASPAFLPAEYDRREAAMRTAAARLAQARRQLALARDQLDYATLRADADGLITAFPAEIGQVVAAGQTVASLAHTAETELVVDVPENRLPEIRGVSRIEATLWSAPGHVLRGRLREVAGLADPASRTFTVRVTLLDPPPGLIGLGMTASARFIRDAGPPIAVLPASAIVDRHGQPSVWVLDPAQQRAILRPVEVRAYRGDGEVQITGGVRA